MREALWAIVYGVIATLIAFQHARFTTIRASIGDKQQVIHSFSACHIVTLVGGYTHTYHPNATVSPEPFPDEAVTQLNAHVGIVGGKVTVEEYVLVIFSCMLRTPPIPCLSR